MAPREGSSRLDPSPPQYGLLFQATASSEEARNALVYVAADPSCDSTGHLRRQWFMSRITMHHTRVVNAQNSHDTQHKIFKQI